MRRVLPLLYTVSLAACAFEPSGLEPGAIDAAADDGATIDGDPTDDGGAIDASVIDGAVIDASVIDAAVIDAVPIDATPIDAPGPVVDIIHVRAVDESIGAADLTIAGTVTITTSGTPSSSAPLPGGSLVVVPQDGGGTDLVLLRVRALTIGAGAVLRATGSRPLVILAETALISGWIDGSASGGTAGAGALTVGVGVGGSGGHVMQFSDGGGGGASFGGNGADGGDAPCNFDCMPNQTAQGGGRGTTYGAANLTRLEGGSPGGHAFVPTNTQCPVGGPGAGGGAIQLYARTSIAIGAGGGIAAGGGGGDGGDRCDQPFNWLGGHGGGSGGAIYLQSSSVQNAGVLVANGGGGGGSAGQDGDGSDGTSAGRAAALATGGGSMGQYSASGGDGAIQGTAAEAGGNGPDQGNGGGGGGGLGRIHVRSITAAVLGTTSPTATTSTF